MGASVLDPRLVDAGATRDDAGDLLLDGVPLAAIADAIGTPAYVYNASAIRTRYASLESALAGLPHRICYAVKANSNLAVLRLLRALGAGADIVSGGELLRALTAGFAPDDIVFSGVGKTDEELLAAMSVGVGQINVESIAELERLALLCDLHDHDVAVGIRVNPDVTVETHPYVTTGKGGIKFGIPRDQFAGALAVIDLSSRITLRAVAMHVGSQLLSAAPYAAGVERLLELLAFAREQGHHPEVLDIGGGLGIRYADELPLAPAEWIAPLRPLLAGSACAVHIEPGRFIVGAAGVLLTRVTYTKHSGGRSLAVVDAAMNDLIRPALYRAWHEIIAVHDDGRNTARLDVVGPICETGDFLALDRDMPAVASGDLLAVLGAGAYGFAMSSNYNTRARAAEVLVDRGRWGLIRPRERLADLFAAEIAEPFATEVS